MQRVETTLEDVVENETVPVRADFATIAFHVALRAFAGGVLAAH